MKYLSLLVILFLFETCNMEPDQKVSYYYNVDSLLASQKHLLVDRRAVINKSAIVEGDSSKGTINSDSLGVLEKEFAIFEDININKPTLKGIYQTKDYPDHASNLMIREYSADKMEAGISLLKIFYLNNIHSIRRLEARYIEDNPIYHTERALRFTFDDMKGKSILRHYEIDGMQKMILRDTVRYKILADIVF